MNTDLTPFDALKARVAEIAAPAHLVVVTDSASVDEALIVAKEVKTVAAAIEDKRKELVGPLNAEVKRINDYAKSLGAALGPAESYIKNQLVAYELQLERERREAARKLEEERRAREAEAEAERERITLEAQGAHLFGVAPDPLAEQKLDALADSVAEDRALDEMAAKNIQENKVSGARKQWVFEVTDPNAVPREYMVVDPKLLRAAVTLGKREIPGVRIYQETKIAIRRG